MTKLCIDLIFTDQPNLSVNSGIHASLHPNSHHQIVQSKFDLNIFYTPPYQRLVRDYKKAVVSNIQKALDLVSWEKLFGNKNIDIRSQSSVKQIKYIQKFCSKKVITCNDKDPISMNEKIKSKVKSKNQLYKVYIKNDRNKTDFFNFKNFYHLS